jgi:DNA-binding response OmpR family regulator
MARSRILIVEDCPTTRQALCDLLKGTYDVEVEADAESALPRLADEDFDLIILDLGLPQMDGYKFCARIRAQEKTAKTPIIIFSGRNDIEDKLVGFSLGACDYVQKPVDWRELKARIQIQLKNSAVTESVQEEQEIGPLRINLIKQRAFIHDTAGWSEINLSPLEFKLLNHFLSHVDHVINREQLLDQVWGRDHHVSDRSVDVMISKLRAKLGPHGTLLQSVRGAGYRFNRPGKTAA